MDYVVTILKYLEIEKNIELLNETGETLFNLLHKVCDTKSMIINSYGYKEQFGGIHVKNFSNNVADIFPYKHVPTNERYNITEGFNTKNKYFSNALWFIRDNSVSPLNTTISSKEEIMPYIIYANEYYTCSDGDLKRVLFTEEELKESTYWLQRLKEHSIKKSEMEEIMPDKAINRALIPYDDTTSFSRAFLYLDIARRETFLPAKIAGYITILEIICAVKGENTYKVSERVAALLGVNSEDKLNIFLRVKKAYDFRSKYVHGSHIKFTDVSKVIEVSTDLDEIVRKVLKKVIKDCSHLNYYNKPKGNQLNFDRVDNEFVRIVLSS
ncbi:HEPN domain-containing protein [Lysinibacillus sp. 1 U-2021]|uniref:HEPN domain-containing protein n=1 Tax=Lysinibacillus sp. 1 U-2021 TaxID=3039426 RepID=UPI002480774E|nr:HEPN domain-containing protein [Lysinibacillus sp. 1 U-2021]WGT38104.1 HEPN domain-containing protein [Lysinibacillus sp. 1 U-2021]